MTRYICIKRLRNSAFAGTIEPYYISIGDIIDIDFNELNYYDGTWSIFININGLKFRSSIYKLDIDHFITIAEWRDRQLNSILND